ncbi:TRAP transporter small permease [Prosthecomicrobium sp. N25]|uniref:TRAP transporter small permease n=1 Tax=Prosthecomicrobium sp. N25 TaxID=3129254 RepID=UPI00307803D1
MTAVSEPRRAGAGARALALAERFEEALLVGTLAATFAALLLQVGSRYLFDLPLAWTEEAARYLFIWSVFIGASQAMRRREHIAIGFFVERLPHRLQQAIALVMHALSAAFLLVVIVKGAQIADKVADLPATATEVSMALVYLPLPLAGTVMLLRTLAEAVAVARRGPVAVEHRSL